MAGCTSHVVLMLKVKAMDVAREGAAASLWHVTASLKGGFKDPKLTKKRGKHNKKNIKNY